MTTNLLDHSPAIAAAIRQAFGTSQPCHCHTEAKLSENEILYALANQRVIRAVDVDREDWLPLDRVWRFRCWDARNRLEERGVRYVHELTAWTYADLLALPGVGPYQVDSIEAKMAEFGLLLKDGHPNRIAEAEEREPTSPFPANGGSPDEIRTQTAKSLMKLARRYFDAGTSIMNRAIGVSTGKRSTPTLKNYVTRRMPGHEAIARIIGPLADLEARDAASRKLATKPRQGRVQATKRPLVREGRVIHGAFAATGD